MAVGKTMSPWLYLSLAIAFEVLATSALKESQGMKQIMPAVLAYLGYGISFYLLALALKGIPLGMAYAIWSGVGIVVLSIIGFFVYQQTLSYLHLTGIGLIALGVVLLKIG